MPRHPLTIQPSAPTPAARRDETVSGSSRPAVAPLQKAGQQVVTPPAQEQALPFQLQPSADIRVQPASEIPSWSAVQQQKAGSGKVVQRVEQVLSKVEGHFEEDTSVMQVDGPPKEVFVIEDVIIGGRTPSPYSGTMGAHSTAWIAHIDAVRRYLVGTDLNQGLEWFLLLIKEDLDSPMLKLAGHLSKDHWGKLDFATFELKQHSGVLKEWQLFTITRENYHRAIQQLRQTINAYLTFINYLPMATVDGGDPSGHGEGAARNELSFFDFAAALKHQKNINQDESDLTKMNTPVGKKEFEETNLRYGAVSETDVPQTRQSGLFKGMDKELRSLLKGTLKDEELDNYRVSVRNTLWVLFAEETPEVYAKSIGKNMDRGMREEIWALAIQNFMKTTRLAYPYAYDFAQMQDPVSLLEKLNKIIFSVDHDRILKLIEGTEEFTAIAGSYDYQDPQKKDVIKAPLDDNNKLSEAMVRPSGVGLSDAAQGSGGLKVAVLVDEAAKIMDVVMTGRTKSPFSSTMGAHSAAWIAHTDAVAKQLRSLSLKNGIIKLAEMARGMLTDPSLKLAGYLSEKHQIYLVGAYNVVSNDFVNKHDYIAKYGQTGPQIAFLESFVKQYLNLVNLLPLSTVERGGLPNGRAEGQHRNFLLRYESEGDKVFTPEQIATKKEILQAKLKGLLDRDAISHFPPSLISKEKTDINSYVAYGFDKEHPLWENVNEKQKPLTTLKLTSALQRFYNTVEEAYPRAVKDCDFLEYLNDYYAQTLISPERKREEKQRELEVEAEERRQKELLLEQGDQLLLVTLRSEIIVNKQVRVVRYRKDPLGNRHIGLVGDVRLVYGDKATVMLPDFSKVTFNLLSLRLAK